MLSPEEIPAAEAESDRLRKSFGEHFFGAMVLLGAGGVTRYHPELLHEPNPTIARLKAFAVLGASAIAIAKTAVDGFRMQRIDEQIAEPERHRLKQEIAELQAGLQ